MSMYYTCPACGGKFTKPHRENRHLMEQSEVKYTMHLCIKCGTQFAIPRVSASEEFYMGYTKPIERWEFAQVINSLTLDSKADYVLDVGCGDGSFVSILGQHGIHSLGIDLNCGDVDRAKEKGLNCIHSSIEQLDTDQVYSAITLFHVIEHVEDPSAILQKLHRLLQSGGYVYLSLPSTRRTELAFRRDIADYPPNHLTRITPLGIKLMAERSGWKIRATSNEPYTNSWMKETSFVANQVLERIRLKKPNEASTALVKLVKTFMFLIVQPWILFVRCSYNFKKPIGYTDLYCLERE